MRTTVHRVSRKRRCEARLAGFLAALAKLDVPIKTVSDDPEAVGQVVFSDNVINRFDDGVATDLDRFVLVTLDDANYGDDYLVHSFKVRKRLLSNLQHVAEACYIVALDLDAGHVLRVDFEHKAVIRQRRSA